MDKRIRDIDLPISEKSLAIGGNLMNFIITRELIFRRSKMWKKIELRTFVRACVQFRALQRTKLVRRNDHGWSGNNFASCAHAPCAANRIRPRANPALLTRKTP
jgi:hypothetical protein